MGSGLRFFSLLSGDASWPSTETTLYGIDRGIDNAGGGLRLKKRGRANAVVARCAHSNGRMATSR